MSDTPDPKTAVVAEPDAAPVSDKKSRGTGSRRAQSRSGRVAVWADDRLGLSRFVGAALNKIFPDHWSFMVGEIAMYSFIVLIVTGTYLTFFFVPSLKGVVYKGSYAPLQGVYMSEAYQSVVHMSLEVRAGLVMRQIHHWAAIVFIGAIVVHVCRVFFTGAFRRPRELNWIIGVTMLVLAIVNGFAGYSLPDDLLSGTGLRVAYSIMLSVPVVGTWAAFLIFGGAYPAESIIARLYVIHILIVPALIVGLLTAHLAIMWHQKHTQFAGRGRTEDNVVGSALWPTYAAKSVGFFAMTSAVLAALGGLAQINPVWLYGPYNAAQVSSASQPDWYMGWLDGALRIWPNWEIRLFHHTVANTFFPGVLLAGATFTLLALWPFLEARFTKDRAVHHLLDRPRDRPLRTSFGVATLTFYVVLFAGGGTDVLAVYLGISENGIIWTLRALVILLPIVAGFATFQLCRQLASVKGGKRRPPDVIVRNAAGGYSSHPAPKLAGTEEPDLEPTFLAGAHPKGDTEE